MSKKNKNPAISPGASQSKLYQDMFDKHGPSVNAVASGDQIYKNLRYKKIINLFSDDADFSVHDVGFGLGHFWEYMQRELSGTRILYSGSEVTEQFVSYCKAHYPEMDFRFRDLADGPFEDKYDYLVFGGTFYHLAETPSQDFQKYIFSLIENAFSMSRRGVSFNLITEYVDYRRNDLFYCSMPKLLEFLNSRLSRFFTIHHNYPLYEYTVCVYQETYIKSKYPQANFEKYFKTKKSS